MQNKYKKLKPGLVAFYELGLKMERAYAQSRHVRK